MTSLQHDYTGAPIWEHRSIPRGASVYQGPTGATDPQSSSARTIAAKFAGKCPLCKGAIEAGDQVRWEPGRKAVHLECPVNEPAPAPAPEPAPEAEVVEVQVVLARVAEGLTDEQIERAYLAPGIDNITLAVLDAELDARMEEAVASSAPDAAPVVAQEPRQPARLGLDEVGVYVLPDGAVVKVQANREKTKVYAKRWTPSRQDRLMGDGHHEHGEYVYEPGLVREVEATGRKMTLEEAKAHSVRYGRCVRCGRQLTDGKSVEQGMGPVCIRYFS